MTLKKRAFITSLYIMNIIEKNLKFKSIDILLKENKVI